MEWLCLHGNLQGYVRSPTGRHFCQQTAQETPRHSRLLQATTHTRLIQAKSRPVWFNLAVDGFGIKYIGKDNLQHLYDALHKETYNIVEDQVGDLYCGINLSWHYDKGYVDLSIPKYVMKQLTRYAHPPPVKPQHCPFSPNPINGKYNQATTPADDSPLLDDAGKK
jgi:hypothetical protein